MRDFRHVAFAAITVSGVLGINAACAADMVVKAPIYKAVAQPSAYNWTGCYVGANVGWYGGDRIDLYPSGTIPVGSDPAFIQANSHSYTPRGAATGGVQVGCNRQIDHFVFGVEADVNGGLKQGSSETFGNIRVPPRNWTPHTETVAKTFDWYSTFRARAGYAFDRLLIYGTGGLAVAQINASMSYDGFTVNNFSFAGSTTSTRVGYAAGAGLEYLLNDRWTIRAEYLYLDFGSFSFDSPNVAVSRPGEFWGTTVHAHEHVGRVGVNYKFDWAGPVVAKY